MNVKMAPMMVMTKLQGSQSVLNDDWIKFFYCALVGICVWSGRTSCPLWQSAVHDFPADSRDGQELWHLTEQWLEVHLTSWCVSLWLYQILIVRRASAESKGSANSLCFCIQGRPCSANISSRIFPCRALEAPTAPQRIYIDEIICKGWVWPMLWLKLPYSCPNGFWIQDEIQYFLRPVYTEEFLTVTKSPAADCRNSFQVFAH